MKAARWQRKLPPATCPALKRLASYVPNEPNVYECWSNDVYVDPEQCRHHKMWSYAGRLREWADRVLLACYPSLGSAGNE